MPDDTGSPTVDTSPAPTVLTEAQGVDALVRMRRPAAGATATGATSENSGQAAPEPNSAQPDLESVTDDTLQDDTVGDDAEQDDALDRDPATQVSDPIFHLDDGTPVDVDEARRGYMRREDYSRKTEATSEVLRIAELRTQVVDQAAAFMEQRLPYVMEILKSSIPAEPDPSLRETEPMKFWDQFNDRKVKMERLQQLEAEWSSVQTMRAETQRAMAHEKFVTESQLLLDKLPAWRDPRVAMRERTALSAYGRKMGYSDAELAQADHRAVLILRDAALGARVRAAGGKKPPNPKPPPAAEVRNTAGITSGVSNGANRPSVDPNASRRVRFDQGVDLLARRKSPT